MSNGPRKAALAFILITVFLDVLALGIVIPVMPALVANFLGGDVQRAAVVFGMFVTIWEAMQFFFSPLLGALSDRYGRRVVILASNFGLGLDYILMALAPSLPWLVVGRLVSGITAASFPTAGAYIADVMPPEKRAQGFGMLGAAFGIGFIVGPAIGGLLGSFDPRLPFWVAGAFSLLNAAYGYFVLPESLPPEKRTPFAWKNANPVGSLTLLRRHRELFGLSAAAFIMGLAHYVLQSTSVLYVDYRYHWGQRTVGLLLAAVGLCGAVVQGGLAGPITRVFGERRTMLTGLVFGAIGFAVYGLAPTGQWFAIGVPIVAVWGLTSPTSLSLMSARIGVSEQGQLQGALTSLNAIAGIIGPPIFTRAFAWAIGTSPGNGPIVGLPFYLSSALLVVALGVAIWATRPSAEVSASPEIPKATT